MRIQGKNRERGVALLFSILALMLLTAIGATLILMATTETSINSNYRQEQIAYFGAKAGLEEARARMMQSDLTTINALLPFAAPTTSGPGSPGVVYIVNPGSGGASSVQPWDKSANSDKYPDDELCHDGYVGYTNALFTSSQVTAPQVRCDPTLLPGGTWYTSTSSQLPFANKSSALPFKWVRVSPKLNGSVSYLTGMGSTATVATYMASSAAGTTAATVMCWDGTEEVPLKTTATKCSDMLNAAGSPMTTVYLITALGVSPTGARKMLQAEAALTPTPPFPYGLYSTATVCPAITFTGNSPSTDSYTTSGYTYTESPTGGDIGSNGGIDVGNGNIGGIVGVLQPAPAGVGTCATPVSMSSQGTMLGTVACPTGDTSHQPTSCFLPAPYVFPTPPTPNPLPPTGNQGPNTCYTTTTTTTTTKVKGKLVTTTTTTTTPYDCLAPGTYADLNITSAVILAPGTYNINSFSMSGNGQIIVSPAGAVTFNVAGVGQATPISITGNGTYLIGNMATDPIANDFIFNYGGTGAVQIAGNGEVVGILNAPNAAVSQKGNGSWYGSILASTMTIGGNAFFHYDRDAALSPNNNGYYTMVSFREVPY